MSFWIQLPLATNMAATNESWIVGYTFPSLNMVFAFAGIIFQDTWSMRDLHSKIHLSSFSSISMITGFYPLSIFFIDALAVISSMVHIHSLTFFLSLKISTQINLRSVIVQTWQHLSYKTLYTTLLSHDWRTKVLKCFLCPSLTNVSLLCFHSQIKFSLLFLKNCFFIWCMHILPR